jgi:hypothetical protein
MSRHARIEIVPPRAACDPHEATEDCPVMDATEEQCLRYLAPSGLPHHLRLIAGNGRTLASSEKYANLTNARRAVKSWLYAFAEVLRVDMDMLDLIEAPSVPLHIVELDIDGKQVRP